MRSSGRDVDFDFTKDGEGQGDRKEKKSLDNESGENKRLNIPVDIAFPYSDFVWTLSSTDFANSMDALCVSLEKRQWRPHGWAKMKELAASYPRERPRNSSTGRSLPGPTTDELRWGRYVSDLIAAARGNNRAVSSLTETQIAFLKSLPYFATALQKKMQPRPHRLDKIKALVTLFPNIRPRQAGDDRERYYSRLLTKMIARGRCGKLNGAESSLLQTLPYWNTVMNSRKSTIPRIDRLKTLLNMYGHARPERTDEIWYNFVNMIGQAAKGQGQLTPLNDDEWVLIRSSQWLLAITERVKPSISTLQKLQNLKALYPTVRPRGKCNCPDEMSYGSFVGKMIQMMRHKPDALTEGERATSLELPYIQEALQTTPVSSESRLSKMQRLAALYPNTRPRLSKKVPDEEYKLGSFVDRLLSIDKGRLKPPFSAEEQEIFDSLPYLGGHAKPKLRIEKLRTLVLRFPHLRPRQKEDGGDDEEALFGNFVSGLLNALRKGNSFSLEEMNLVNSLPYLVASVERLNSVKPSRLDQLNTLFTSFPQKRPRRKGVAVGDLERQNANVIEALRRHAQKTGRVGFTDAELQVIDKLPYLSTIFVQDNKYKTPRIDKIRNLMTIYPDERPNNHSNDKEEAYWGGFVAKLIDSVRGKGAGKRVSAEEMTLVRSIPYIAKVLNQDEEGVKSA